MDGRLINIIVNVRDISHFREAQQMKSTFISVISHELKTPVALIKGYAGTLRREDADWDPAVVQESLTVIEEEADRLTELIENLKPIAERNRITLAQLAVSWVLRRKEVTAAIVGARRPEQIEETAKAGDWELAGEDIEQIEQLLKQRQEKINAK